MIPKHTKVKTYSKQDDDTVRIDSKSYHEKLSYELVEYEKQQLSSFAKLKQDVEENLKHVINDGSPKLVLTIEMKNQRPKITKRWVALRKHHPRM